jgi:gluconate 2-dehydrogenase gamma chain
MPDEIENRATAVQGAITRRTVLASATFVPVAALTAAAQTATTALSSSERRTLEAFLDRLCPKDELGPGAVECGAASYIDRALADALAAEKGAFLEGLSSLETLARQAGGSDFASLPGETRDEIITSMENGSAAGFPNARAFFNRARRLMLEGMFSDPYYGGNKEFAGWDLIRYPGPRLAVAPDDQKMNTAIKPYRVSAYGKGAEHGH